MITKDKSARSPLVLIANDQEWSARSLESILEPNGFSVLRAFTGQQALERARTERPDLIILDAQMPDMHGFDVCRVLRDDPRLGATTPIVITTAGPSGRTQRLEAYQAGAWEFLGQPLDGEALLLKLQTFVQSKLENDRIRDESLVDPNTGLYNMRGLSRRAREIGSEALRRHDPLACVVFAPDPESGTRAEPNEEEWQRVAQRMGEVFHEASRTSDAVGRLGPSEFAVIAPATNGAGAIRLAERLGGQMEASPVPVRGGERWVKIKAGYCAVPDFAESSVDAVELLLRATTALRDVSKSGDVERVRSFDQLPLRLPG
jgi:two-component system cell cycle response regulator